MEEERILVWHFETKNFKIACEAEPTFVDPLVHNEMMIDAVHRGQAQIEHLRARVYWKGTVEVGRAEKRDCVDVGLPPAEFSPYYDMVDSVFALHRGHRNQVVKWAIADARKALAELDLPGLRLRKPG